MKWVVRKKKEEGALTAVAVVVVAIGGNDLGELDGREQRVVMGIVEFSAWMEDMVVWMLAELPGVELRVMDVIPRHTKGGIFVDAVRRWNLGVKCQEEGRHRHVSTWRMFISESRRWKLQSGKGNRGNKAEKDKKRRGPLPRNCERFQLRHGLFHDSLHLSVEGKEVLISLLKWQLSSSPSSSKDVNISVPVQDELKKYSLSAHFKF